MNVLQLKSAVRRSAFTIIELMVAIFMFAMIIMAIYATWLAIIRGTSSGLKGAAEVQRSRIALATLENALMTSQLFVQNIFHYAFLADTSGELASVTMVSRLPADFPGVGRYGDQIVRRVTFYVRPGRDGNELVMVQAPMLMDTNSNHPAYSIILAKDVTQFSLEFYNAQLEEWEDEWKHTNSLPALVKVTLGLGKKGKGGLSHDEASTLVALPGAGVAADLQRIQGQPQSGRPPSGGKP